MSNNGDIENLIDEEKYSPALKALNTLYHALLMQLDKPAYEDEYATVAEFIINRTPKILRMNNARRVYKKKPIERRTVDKK